MDLRNYFKEQYPMPGLLGVEKLAAIYAAFTLLLAAVLSPDMEMHTLVEIIGGRVAIAIVVFLLYRLYHYHPCHATYQLRVVFQFLLLGYWYPDIYNFAAQMPNLDYILANADQWLFGCQPAIAFPRAFSGTFWRELFDMGYASYFVIIIAAVAIPIFRRPRRFDSVTFVVMCSFFLYYIVFLLVSTAGPQYYFNAPGVDAAKGIFPAVDDWFRTHSTLQSSYCGIDTSPRGIFGYIVKFLHGSEKPIAAFPSSHVGASTVILILMFRMKKKYGFIMLPFYIILCLSTVYIGAHYGVDVIFGWISAILFYYISRRLYKNKFFHRPKGFDSLHRFGHHHQHHHQHSHHSHSH